MCPQGQGGPGWQAHPPPCRQLSVMLMLAQSNPQLFALIGTQANLARELDRVEQQSRLEQLSPEELQSRNRARWADWLQEYRVRLEKDMEGAGDVAAWQAERVRVMQASNPKYVLRNYIAQRAIEAAEKGDFSEASVPVPSGPGRVDWPAPLTRTLPPGTAGAEAAGVSVPQRWGGSWRPRGCRGSPRGALLQQQAPALGGRAVCDLILVVPRCPRGPGCC